MVIFKGFYFGLYREYLIVIKSLLNFYGGYCIVLVVWGIDCDVGMILLFFCFKLEKVF